MSRTKTGNTAVANNFREYRDAPPPPRPEPTGSMFKRLMVVVIAVVLVAILAWIVQFTFATAQQTRIADTKPERDKELSVTPLPPAVNEKSTPEITVAPTPIKTDPAILPIPQPLTDPQKPFRPTVNSGRGRFYPETSHNLQEPFLSYFDRNGGLTRFGLPLSDEFREQGKTVQYFERARLELNLDNTVSLGLIGTLIADKNRVDNKNFDKVKPFASVPERDYFDITGHSLTSRFGFKTFFYRNGGAALLGYPISEEFEEKAADGKYYWVQYFERARLEYHPERKGSPGEIQLGRLGAEYLSQIGLMD